MSVISADAMPRPNLLSVLRIRNFALLWSGQAISQIGDGLFYMAQIWLVLQLTGSALAMGTTLILTLLPRLAFQLIGGVSVDRYDRRMMMFLSDSIRSVVVLIFAILVATNQIQMIHIYFLSIIFGIISAFFQPAQSALIPNVVPTDSLIAANSLRNLTQQFSQILGPAIAGTLIAVPFIGVAGVSFLNAASFAIGALGIWLVRLPDHLNGARKTNTSFTHDLRDGFRYLLRFRALLLIMLLSMALNFAASPIEVLLPLFAKNILGQGSAGVGVLMASLGIGMVLGSLGIGVWSPHARRGALAFTATAIAGVLFLMVGIIPIFGVTFILFVTMGVLIAIVNTVLTAVMQAMIVDEYRGRVFSLDALISMGLAPLAIALSGVVADAIGPSIVIIAGGVIVVVVSLIGLTFREIRELQ
jgi:DHA3 family macrolide efflux protein-like MFS transporter